MKKVKYIIFSFLCSIVGMSVIYASPSYSFSTSSSSIENGGKVTASVTVKNTAAWNLKITSSGNTSGCSNSWADATSDGNNSSKTFSVTCRATSTGVIAFTVSGDVTSSDGSNINVSGTKSVSVKEATPDSTINTLKSLSIDGYTLSPEFSSDTLDYTVTVPSTINIVKINATKEDSKSSISGDGEIAVEEGANKINVVVTSESGATRTYTINVTVEDTNPIKRTINGIEYSIIKNSKNLDIPSNYIESTINIDGTDVPCFTNEINNITLIAMKDSSGNIKFFTYDNNNFKEYIELSNTSLIVMPESINNNIFKNWTKIEITINNNIVEALQYKNQTNYYILYCMDVSTGNSNYYLYDSINNTFQIFNEELYNSLNEDINFYLYMLCGAGGLIFICLLIIILSVTKKRPKNRKNNLKEVENIEPEINLEPVNNEEQQIEESTEPKLSKKELKKLARAKKKEQKELAKKEAQTQEENEEETYNILNDD